MSSSIGPAARLRLLPLLMVLAAGVASGLRAVMPYCPRERAAFARAAILRACDAGGGAIEAWPSLEDTPFWRSFAAEAEAEAEELGLEVRDISFVNGKLAVLASGAGVDELQYLNRRLSEYLDQCSDEAIDALPPFLLEVSSPGLSPLLTTDRDFVSFRGFPVVATTTEPFKKKTQWEGTLIGRDAEFVSVNLKGRVQKIPIELVEEVRLPDPQRENGDSMAM